MSTLTRVQWAAVSKRQNRGIKIDSYNYGGTYTGLTPRVGALASVKSKARSTCSGPYIPKLHDCSNSIGVVDGQETRYLEILDACGSLHFYLVTLLFTHKRLPDW